MRLPPQDYLRECFDYDPETGELRWKVRPRDHFQTIGAWKSVNSRCAGKLALCHPHVRSGQLMGSLSFEGETSNYYQTYIIWKLMTGDEPLKEINHRDGNVGNNRWKNLREATHSEAMASSKPMVGTAVEFKGVKKHGKRFHARISYQNTRLHIGVYDTPELASAAYAAKAQELFGEFART